MKMCRLIGCGTLLFGVFAWAPTTPATPYHTPELDGRPVEYDSTDLRGTFEGANSVAGNVITNLYVTWDEDYLYLALQGVETGNKLAILIDVDPGNGTGATTTTNWADPSITADYIRFNDVGWQAATNAAAVPFGLDYMAASEGFFNNFVRVLYDDRATPTVSNVTALFDSGNGATPTGAETDMAVLSNDLDCDWKGFEARIPWTELYNTNLNRFGSVLPGEVVPRGATLRLFANIHNNTPNDAYSLSDTIPEQVSVLSSWSAGLLTSDDYIDVSVDGDSDGLPDGMTTDVNAPYFDALLAAVDSKTVYVLFNEPVATNTTEIEANWEVNGETPLAADQTDERSVFLTRVTALPATQTLVTVSATNIEDSVGNTRPVEDCVLSTADGIQTNVTVRFLLETASGMGANQGASNFFVNGSSAPLEFGFPPAKSTPLTNVAGSLYGRDVTFPPGTPQTINYKYSAELDTTGTNNYEAIRLADFDTAARVLDLDPTAGMMVLTDYLGAAATPLRNPSDTNQTAYADLYTDPNRADAGVRNNRSVTFQLDLSRHDTNAFDRVIIQGTDPLRGFNLNNSGVADFAGSGAVGWDIGGLELVDDGTLGDTNANDGIYTREWRFTTTGTDATVVPGVPNSLVGGDTSTAPYNGFGWADGRSPRSFIYKYYVINNPAAAGPTVYESPASDIEVYLDESASARVFDAFEWDNLALPLKPPSNAPTLIEVETEASQSVLVFTNLLTEAQHGIEVSTDLAADAWRDYGQLVSGSGTLTARVNQVEDSEIYRLYAGAPELGRAEWTPNPIPESGATLSVTFNQSRRNLAGFRDIRWFGRILSGSFTNLIPMNFQGQGEWTVDIPVPPATNNSVQFLFTDPGLNAFDKKYNGSDFYINVGGPVDWTPEQPAPGDDFTVTYDASGSVLATATQVLFHHGFDNFQNVTTPAMTNIGAASNQWSFTVTVPMQYSNAVDWVFQDGAGTFDNNGNNDWRAFINP